MTVGRREMRDSMVDFDRSAPKANIRYRLPPIGRRFTSFRMTIMKGEAALCTRQTICHR